MPSHSEHIVSHHTVQQLFDLVADIESYPQFLPWCVAARILAKGQNALKAELVIRFKAFREKYVSEVTLLPAKSLKDRAEINVALVEGPFSQLSNHWIFTPLPSGGTEIAFTIDFSFRSALLERLIGFMFQSAVEKMVAAFEARANVLYSVF